MKDQQKTYSILDSSSHRPVEVAPPAAPSKIPRMIEFILPSWIHFV